jgi:hypothetical protein
MLAATRVLAFGLGAMLMFIAVLLREDEEGGVQNTIEALWIRLDDWRSATGRWNRRLFAISATVVQRLADRALGPKLLSIRVVATFACVTIASPWIALKLLPGEASFSWLLPGSLLVAVIVPVVLKRARFAPIVGAAFGIGFTLLMVVESTFLLSIVLGATAISVACGISSSVGVRILLRRLSSRPTLLSSVVAMSLVVAGVALFVLMPLRLALSELSRLKPHDTVITSEAALSTVTPSTQQSERDAPVNCGAVLFWLLAAGMNTVSVLLLLMFGATCLIFTLHNLIWPIIERPVYAIARHGVFKYRKSIFTAGAILMAIGSPRIAELIIRAGTTLKLD